MIVPLDNQFIKNSYQSFKIEGIIQPSKAKVPNGKADVEMTDVEEGKNGKDATMKGSNNLIYNTISGMSEMLYASTEDGSTYRVQDGIKHTSHSHVMLERWTKANALTIPQLDCKDILEENPNFTLNKKKTVPLQPHPEYTQSSYLRLRNQEDAFRMQNYLSL